jgi:DNA-binding response OmpR family regulator
MNVLLVEPDRILGKAAEAKLKTAGHTVIRCQSAQGALDALDQNPPDVIILELQLGIHNGIEFLYEMRSYTEWQHIPVIVHTINSHVSDDQFKKPLAQLGVESVLYKPRTTGDKLVQAVRRLT